MLRCVRPCLVLRQSGIRQQLYKFPQARSRRMASSIKGNIGSVMCNHIATLQGSNNAAIRRINMLRTSLSYTNPSIRFCSSKGENGKFITIGDVSKPINRSKFPELVPRRYIREDTSQTLLQHLRWIMQKDLLGQDIFLIGAPGPLRRAVAMMYLEMTNREAEYVSLSRDTTESDLKQRREIKGGTAYHLDQCAVLAAIHGRVLILEGIEKAERNVLPVLNNLLENREMQLDDGRFLMAAERYDKLLQDHDKSEMDAWKLVRVSEDFRVIALGLPVPRYRGNPLDPPLRSRFQARDINPLPFKDQIDALKKIPGANHDRLTQILSCAVTLRSSEATSLGLPDFPLDNLNKIISIMGAMPEESSYQLIKRLYPYDLILNKEGRNAVQDALQSFSLLETESTNTGNKFVSEVSIKDNTATVQITEKGKTHHIQVPAGTSSSISTSTHSGYVSTPYNDHIIAELMQSHMVSDFCIIGPRGSGKSMLMKQFADLLGYEIEPIMLYQDMTARDLLQQRTTEVNGDTSWRPSPLIQAAKDGHIAVLDGMHRVNAGSFAVLHRLIHDRELSLFDGSRLLRHDRYDEIKQDLKVDDAAMEKRGLYRIHPSFRVVALSEPPVVGSSSQQWLNSELLTAFLYHNMRELAPQEELSVIKKLVPNMSDMSQLMAFSNRLRQSTNSSLQSIGGSLSTRQLLRIARRQALYSGDALFDVIEKACLARFLPRLARTALEDEMEHVGITKTEPRMVNEEAIQNAITCEVKDGVLRIGNTTTKVHQPENLMKVPDVLFYENAQHLSVLEGMLQDYLLGEHLLLVGNQGVGKNKLIDRFLGLLNRPREYIQLHRDTTVQTLTLQPTVQDGIIKFEDSPLVKAVKNGHILVVDEADKAPTNVTCILKTLVESGEMHLADGRRIVNASSSLTPSDTVIVAHPEFRMFVLANRPGFPFLGNDFFGAMGDIFSCHAIDNPDVSSEIEMLRQYGPDVPDHVLDKLVRAFGELRDKADQGLISYPYSTREVVNMIKHLQRFPNEGVADVVRNVLDFDSYNKELSETVIETLQKHGIPINANPSSIALAKEFPLPAFQHTGQVDVKPAHLSSVAPIEKQLRIKGPVWVNLQSYPLDRTEARSVLFSEQEAHWTIPLHETSAVVDVAVTKRAEKQTAASGSGDLIHIASVSPISLYTMDAKKRHLSVIDLYDLFPMNRGAFYRPRLHIAPMPAALDHTVVVHEEVSNTILNVNTNTGSVSRLELGSPLKAATDKIAKTFRQDQGAHKMCSQFSQEYDGILLFYKVDSDHLDVLTMLDGRSHSIPLGFNIKSVHMMKRFHWLITDQDNHKYVLTHKEMKPDKYTLKRIGDTDLLDDIVMSSPCQLSDDQLSAVLDSKISSPNRVMTTALDYATVVVGLPDLSSLDIYSSERDFDVTESSSGGGDYIRSSLQNMMTNKPTRPRPQIVYLPESGQVIRALSYNQVPKDVHHDGVKPSWLSGYLEITDLPNKKVRYVPVPGVTNSSVYNQWFHSGTAPNLVLAGMSSDGLVTVDAGGCVRLWETALYRLGKSVGQWRELIGNRPKDSKLQMTYSRTLSKPPTGPKHGKVDKTGAPHVGGDTWAGGTGGRNTAGLGGVGGPYRLDAGHDVYQVSDQDKEDVPEEVLKAAREMGLKAWKERLKEIEMSEYDAELYEKFYDQVKPQIHSLRIILDSLQAKGKERQWLKHQAYGDLDETKLIEGLTGEKGIYKRRGEKDPEMGAPQQKPKVLKLLCDVSGSMYRFNGHDGRLEREMEAMVMVMEAFEKYEHKVKYEIIGHSGEGFDFPMCKSDNAPKNNKERLNVVKTLHAHSQFCMSGDHTLEATKHAITTIADMEADERFVIVLSDANLDRYGIRPHHFSEILTSNEDVNAYAIFIGSLGDQADRLIKQMPSGRAFLCMDTKNLPNILQQIFADTMLKAN